MSNKKYEVYMEMARSIARLSPDKDTQVGAIMLSPENRVVSSSFNGFLRGAPDSDLPTTREDKCSHGHDKYHYIQHAERNILYNCAAQGIRTRNTVIVCTLSPCLECLRACYQSGVKTIIFDKTHSSCSAPKFYETLADVHVKKTMVGKYTRLDMSSSKENSNEFLKALVQC